MKFMVFSEPYPFNSSVLIAFRTALLYGLFIFLFLYIFQPFGLGNYDHPDKIWHIVGYGSVTFFCLSSSNILGLLIFPKLFNESCWTVGKNIIYTTWMFFYIGIGNLVYSQLMGFFEFSLKMFFEFQILTVLVGMFPVSLITVFIYNKKLKDSLQSASELNSSILPHEVSHQEISIPSKNQSEKLKLNLDEFLFAKAVENYIEFHLLKSDGSTNKIIIRNTIKEITDFFDEYQNIEKCHRSYLINLDHVQSFEGNAQGLKITTKGNEKVPVSRSFVSSIKNKLS